MAANGETIVSGLFGQTVGFWKPSHHDYNAYLTIYPIEGAEVAIALDRERCADLVRVMVDAWGFDVDSKVISQRVTTVK